MKLKAKDTIHISSVQADSIRPGEQFEVSDEFGQSLIDRGLATEVGAKKAPEPANKKAPTASNKKG